MLKQIAKSLLVTLFFVSPAFADDTLSNFNQQGDINYPEPAPQDSYFANLAPMPSKTSGYFGANVGVGLMSLKPEVTITNGVTPYPLTIEKKSVVNYGAGVFGGLGTNLGHFYIGGELNLGFNSLSKDFIDNITVPDYQTKLRVKQSMNVGIDIIPGYLNQARSILFYGRLGVGGGYFKLDLENSSTSKTVSTSTSKINFGLRAGLGLEFFINDTFSVRTEYIYTKYSKITGTDTKDVFKYDYKVEFPAAHQLNLGLAFHFG